MPFVAILVGSDPGLPILQSGFRLFMYQALLDGQAVNAENIRRKSDMPDV